jgi:uncharacterized phiE125 gp8 family phage protein
VRVTQPTVEAVSLSEVKHHLGIDASVADDDEYLGGLIAAARILVEERLNQTLVATQWRARMINVSSCSCRGVELPYPPVLFDEDDRPVEVKFKNRDGDTDFVDAKDIEVDDEEFPGRLHVRQSISDACCEAKATVTWWAGRETPEEVPAPIRAALKRIVAGMYGARGDTAEAIYDRDPGVASLLACVSHTGRF